MLHTKTETQNICLGNKLTPDNYGRNTIKTPSKIPLNMSIFRSSAKRLQLLNKFVVNIKGIHLKTQCSASENVSVT